MMETCNVYVSVANLTCNFQPGPSYEFVLQMTPQQARVFANLFRQMNMLEAPNAFRAHLPYIPYHMDRVNHELDQHLKKVYTLIHMFGNEEAKAFVEQLPYFNVSTE